MKFILFAFVLVVGVVLTWLGFERDEKYLTLFGSVMSAVSIVVSFLPRNGGKGDKEHQTSLPVDQPLEPEAQKSALIESDIGPAAEFSEQLRQVLTAKQDPEANLIKQVLAHKPQNPQQRRCQLISRHSQGLKRVDSRFVSLTLLLDAGTDGEGLRWQQQKGVFDDLSQLLIERSEDQAMVLLGAPGCGKSTLLRRLEYDINRLALLGQTAAVEALPQVTWLLSLNEQRAASEAESAPIPGEWLAREWQREAPAQGELDDQLRAGLLLLLDGLNEMPNRGPEDYARRLGEWRIWLRGLVRDYPNSRVVFSCRRLDYSQDLSSDLLRVPHAEFRELDDQQVQEFLQQYLPQQAASDLFADLRDSGRLKDERTPFYLDLEIRHWQALDGPPKDRAALFGGIAWLALKRELNEQHNPRFEQGDLLSVRDRQRITDPQAWRAQPHELPSEGALIPGLERLAFGMQADGADAQRSLPTAQALGILNCPQAEEILAAGADLALLDEDRARTSQRFSHQLFQEYFAARQFARALQFERLSRPWRAADFHPSLQQELAGLSPRQRLPDINPTGWEETALLAALLVQEGLPGSAQAQQGVEAFVAQLAKVNLPLAGRCAAQPELQISDQALQALAEQLRQRSQDEDADLRARQVAGLALGELSKRSGLAVLGFTEQRGPQGQRYLLPPMVELPGGEYRLGSDAPDAGADEKPYQIELAPFRLARYPVTNAEFACFVEAGGYQDQRWWDSAEARDLVQGKLSQEPIKAIVRDLRQRLTQDFEVHSRHFSAADKEQWREIVAWPDEQLELLLSHWFPEGEVLDAPVYWRDAAYNNPLQPVVGMSWYEARAYALWLSAQAGKQFRLPSEAEWEAAAAGQAGRWFPWGDESLDISRANFEEAHLRNTSPVGLFPLGATPEGLVDLAGNVWEWCDDRYTRQAGQPADSRQRVLRGGGWDSYGRLLRSTYRFALGPGVRDSYIGLRLVGG